MKLATECVLSASVRRGQPGRKLLREVARKKMKGFGGGGGVATIYPSGSKKTDESEAQAIRRPKAAVAMCAWPKK